MPNFARMMYTGIIGRRRVSLVEPPICERCGSVLDLQAKHVAYARVVRHAQADVALILSCPTCRTEGAMLVGPDAQAALRQGLTYLALARGSRQRDRKSTRLNSSHDQISYAVFCLKKKKNNQQSVLHIDESTNC